MIKKTIALLFFGFLLQTGTVEAGNYSRCSNGCSAAKCADKSVAEKCAEWCEGIPALEAVFNACRAKQPVGEHANLDAKHLAEQVKHGRAAPPPPPVPPLPAAYDAGAVQAFCAAYAANPAQILIDHAGNVERRVATTAAAANALPPGGIKIKRAGGGNARVQIFIQGVGVPGRPNIVLETDHLSTLAALSVPVVQAQHFEYFRAGVPDIQGGLFYGTPGAPVALQNKGLCYFE